MLNTEIETQSQEDLIIAIKLMTDSTKGWDLDCRNRTTNYIINKCNEYSKFLDLSPLEVFQALEKSRTYSYPNFYQESNQPSFNDDRVFLFDTQADLLASVQQKKGFICPSCGGITMKSSMCNLKNSEGGRCNWKAYGLFGTLGKGIHIAVKDGFAERAIIQEIFLPVAMRDMVNEVDE